MPYSIDEDCESDDCGQKIPSKPLNYEILDYEKLCRLRKNCSVNSNLFLCPVCQRYVQEYFQPYYCTKCSSIHWSQPSDKDCDCEECKKRRTVKAIEEEKPKRTIFGVNPWNLCFNLSEKFKRFNYGLPSQYLKKVISFKYARKLFNFFLIFMFIMVLLYVIRRVFSNKKCGHFSIMCMNFHLYI